MSLASSFWQLGRTKFKYKPSLSTRQFGVLDDDNTEWETMGWKFLSLGEWHTVCSVSRVGGLEVVKLFRQRSQTRANTEPSLIMTRIIKRTSNHSVKLQSLWSKEQKQGKIANSDTLWQPRQVSHINGIQILGKTLFDEKNAFSEKTKFSLKYTVVELAAFFIYVLTGKHSVKCNSCCMAFGSDFDLPPRFWAVHRRFSQSHVLVWGQLFA